jgi:hypothetical protein
MLTEEAKRAALKGLLDAVIESVELAGEMGAPGGCIYAALMTYGFTLNQLALAPQRKFAVEESRKS